MNRRKVDGRQVDALKATLGLSVLDLHPIEDSANVSFDDRGCLC